MFITIAAPITSVQSTKDGQTVLVSTLDSHIRLMDRSGGKLLQTFRGHKNTDYRLRSCFGRGEATVLAGSEDGLIYVWDVAQGTIIAKLAAHQGANASAIAWNNHKQQWASVGTDGKRLQLSPKAKHAGTIQIRGLPA